MKVDRWVPVLGGLTRAVTEAEADSVVETLVCESNVTRVLSFVNAHALMTCSNNKEFWLSLVHSDVLLRDGVGLKLLLSLLGVNPGMNLNGSDFIPKIISRWNRSHKVSLLGTNIDALNKVAMILNDQGFSRISILDGFQPDSSYLDHVECHMPQLIILAMGMPKQERVSALIRKKFRDKGMLVINGGAILDFMSGRVSRAPRWVRKIGCEWLYRFLKEPRRLIFRNLSSIAFIYYSFRYRNKLRAMMSS